MQMRSESLELDDSSLASLPAAFALAFAWRGAGLTGKALLDFGACNAL
jgi:hypothetical protein